MELPPHLKSRNSYSTDGVELLFDSKARNSYFTWRCKSLISYEGAEFLLDWRRIILISIEDAIFVISTTPRNSCFNWRCDVLISAKARNSCIIWRRGICISLEDAEFLFYRKARYSYFTWSGWWNVSWIIPAAVSVSSSIYHFTNMEEPLSIETYFRLKRWLAGAYRLFRLPFYVQHVWNTSDMTYLKNQDLQTAVLSFWNWGSVRKKRND